MDDLISRADAIGVIMGEPTDAHYPSWYASRIKALPSADVVEVIRCKDCKYWKDGKCWNLKGLNKTDGIVNVDDFCAYGERGENHE